jgi:gluconolactonase
LTGGALRVQAKAKQLFLAPFDDGPAHVIDADNRSQNRDEGYGCQNADPDGRCTRSARSRKITHHDLLLMAMLAKLTVSSASSPKRQAPDTIIFAYFDENHKGFARSWIMMRRKWLDVWPVILAGLLLCVARAAAAADSVVADGAKPVLLQEQGAGEGPAWHPELGLLTSGSGHIWRRDREGRSSIYRENAGTNGLLFDRDGRLVMCQPGSRRVSRLELKSGELTVLADRYEGKRFNQPNDLTIDSKGRIYFSDPKYGDRADMELVDAGGRKIEGVYRIDLDGRVTRIITHEVDRPNGLVATPDDKYLFVADNNNNTVGGARKLWRFDLKGDGTVDFATQKLIYDWKQTRGPDGIKLDAAGRLFVAAGINRQNPPFETQDQPTAGIYVFSPAGEFLEFIPIPRDETTNCAFGGDDLKTLFVTAGGSLFSIAVKTPGQPVWPQLDGRLQKR